MKNTDHDEDQQFSRSTHYSSKLKPGAPGLDFDGGIRWSFHERSCEWNTRAKIYPTRILWRSLGTTADVQNARGCSTSESTARSLGLVNTTALYTKSSMTRGEQQLWSGGSFELLGGINGARRIMTDFTFPDTDYTAISAHFGSGLTKPPLLAL